MNSSAKNIVLTLTVYNNVLFFLAQVKNCFKFEIQGKESNKLFNLNRKEV